MAKQDEDNKYDVMDEGDLEFSEDIGDWIPSEKDIEYAKELDVNHNIPKVNLMD